MQTKHTELLQKLIRCKSITPTDAGVLPLLNQYLQKLGFQSLFQTFGTEKEQVLNLYSALNGNGKNLCFAGHTDVVPPGDIAQWTYDPFSAVIKNDILYGRGAVDMKSAIVCFIAAVEEYISQNKNFGTISFLLTADEEGPAKYGTEPMIEWLYSNGIKIDSCIVGEPVSIENICDNIKIGARGSANFIVKIFGVQGHVAYTHRIDNPIKRANQILTNLHAYNFSHTNAIFDRTNIEVTKISSDSGAENMVPNEIEIRFNFRYGSDYDYDSLKDIVKEIVAKNAIKYHIESRTSGNAALWLNENSNLISIAKSSIQQITGKVPTVNTYGGTSDARFIRKYCEAIEIGCNGNTAHQIDECVSLADLELLTRIYLKILQNYFF